MTFADIPRGASLFIDANTFVFYFSPHPKLGPPCTELLQRVQRQEISATTSTDVLSDVAHRMMTIEAIAQQGWPTAGIVRRLRKQPQAIQSLSLFRKAVDDVPNFGVRIVVPPASIVSAAAAASQQFGLLSGDALIVATMHHFGFTLIASHDADFDRVPGLTRYAPA